MSSLAKGSSCAAADFHELVFAVRMAQQPWPFHQLSVSEALSGTAAGATEAELGQAALGFLLRDVGCMRLPCASRRLLALFVLMCCVLCEGVHHGLVVDGGATS